MQLRIVLAALLLSAATAAHAQQTWREPNTDMEFVVLPKGCFQMGLPATAFRETDGLFKQRVRSEMPQHEVCLDGFWMGKNEVRVSDWKKVMGDAKSGMDVADAPVTGVSWEDANEFARRLTAMSNGKARFRLPTEAEWEYACRAGTKAVTEVLGRDKLDGKAWYSSAYSGYSGDRMKTVQPVGLKEANAFGLHDMLGNAWEWVQDGYRADGYAQHALHNPVVKSTNDIHVIRGGGLRTDQRMTRCEARAWLAVQDADDTTGFRLVRDR